MSYFEPQILLQKSPPSRRAAYSDRISWLMAEMSKLAYLKFETIDLEEWAQRIQSLANINEIKTFLLQELAPKIAYTKGREDLKKALNKANFELVETFNQSGTQAFLAKRDKDKIAVLAFRGTEATQFSDIKADLNAIVTTDSGTQIHSGFLRAFEEVEQTVRENIATLNDYSLFVTGHSLGGALALIAVRKLERDNMAACYTFGSPRVGRSEFADSIKTPIYRVINTADIVPRLPPGLSIEIGVDLLRFLRGFFPFFENIASWLDNKVSGYRHHGDMRYLTNCKEKNFSDVRLIANITFGARWHRLFKNRLAPNRHIKDHSIDKYCQKLAAYLQKQGR